MIMEQTWYISFFTTSNTKNYCQFTKIDTLQHKLHSSTQVTTNNKQKIVCRLIHNINYK